MLTNDLQKNRGDNMENDLLKTALSKLDLSTFPKDSVAEIETNDSQITGGRTIIRQKDNVLFTGQFERKDMEDFIQIWKQYRINTKMIGSIKARLIQRAKTMINNYHGEVCPIEVMLYTSNVVASSFSNRRLIQEVADAVYRILRERNKYLQSIKHILEVWKWEQAITVCEIAVGKMAADRDNEEDMELLRYIYDNFHYQEVVNYGCFCGLMESKKESFVIDILDMIHDLSGTEEDKQIGNYFKQNFVAYFPNYYNRIDVEMFRDSKPYVQGLVRKMLDPIKNNLVSQYKSCLIKRERQHILNLALDVIIKNNKNASPYDAVNVLKLASNESISEQLFLSLNLKAKNKQHSKEIIRAIICNYFGTINYPPAIQAFLAMEPSNDYYADARVSLFYQDKISSDDIVEDFLTENRPDRVKVYLSGFFNLKERLPGVRRSTVEYMLRDLSDDKLSIAITNYYQLIKKYRHLYDQQIGNAITMWFGYKATLATTPLRLQDQMTCLNIIDTIINEANSKAYEDFLFYVAEGWNFSPAVSNFARKILKNLRTKKISG